MTNPEEHPSEISSTASTILRFAAYPISAVSAYLAGDVYVRNAIYKNFAKHGFFDGKTRQCDGIQQRTHDEFRQVVRDGYVQGIQTAKTDAQLERLACNAQKFNVLTEQEVAPLVNNPEIMKRAASRLKQDLGKPLAQSAEHSSVTSRLAKNFHNYRHEVREFFEDLGIRNLRDYTKVTHRNQKVEAAVFALTAAGISLGAVLTLSNSKGLMDMLTTKDRSRSSQVG
ncbi:MAG: hypothetical protein SFW63_06705 [Alphaproteobacteria bacterium]|nr:hypothetical protein [Alphaproteobacteria bacterium]